MGKAFFPRISYADGFLARTRRRADYNTVRALVAGEVDTYMGFKFVIVDEDLLPPFAVNSTNVGRVCFAYLKSNVVMATPKPVETTINTRPDKCNAWQVYSKLKGGATRYEDGGVVQIACKCDV